MDREGTSSLTVEETWFAYWQIYCMDQTNDMWHKII